MRGEFLDVAGSRLYYYAAGSRGAGEPIVLIHGFPTSGHLWSDVVSALPEGHRVVVLDLLGYGRSDPAARNRVDIPSHADRVIAVLDELRIARACIAGHGAGGGIAQSIAVRHPHRVSRMCLVNSVMFSEWPTWRGKFSRGVAPVLRQLPSGLTLAMVRRMLLPGFTDRDKGLHDLDLFLRPFDGESGHQALIAHLKQITERDVTSIHPQLYMLDVPASIVCGSDDPFFSVHYGRALSQSIRNSTFEVVEGGRHFLPSESAHSVAAAIRRLLERE